MIPRIVIAAASSGCGKTTFTTGLIDVFIKKGLKVQPFKVGPDYIDTMFHTNISGTFSRNLDSWLLDENTVKHLFVKNAADKDIAIIEGVMGLYDGLGGTSQIASTAHIAEITQSPVILIISPQGMSLSVAAMVKGFINFNKNIKIKGVIINRIKAEAHYIILKTAIEENTGLKVLGYLPDMSLLTFESRHLGLMLPHEVNDIKTKISLVSEQIIKSVDINAILNIARSAKVLPLRNLENFNYSKKYICNKNKIIGKNKNILPKYINGDSLPKPVIAVAMDRAFNFYYRDNLDLLEKMGAELVYFSPLQDKFVPSEAKGIYFGGGYPELFAAELEQNRTLRLDIKSKIENGMPVYAECGGLMYMSQSILDLEERCYEMVGVIQAKSLMTSKLQRFGYVEVETQVQNILSLQGERIRAHEFHYSDIAVEEVARKNMCCKVCKRTCNGEKTWHCGFRNNNLFAQYPHIHFWSNPQYAFNFLNNCSIYASWSNKK